MTPSPWHFLPVCCLEFFNLGGLGRSVKKRCNNTSENQLSFFFHSFKKKLDSLSLKPLKHFWVFMPSRFFMSWLPDTEMPVCKLSIDKMLCLKKESGGKAGVKYY